MAKQETWERALFGAAGGVIGLGAMALTMKVAERAQRKAHDARMRRRQRRGEPIEATPEPPSGNGAHKPRSMSIIGTHHRPGEPATAALGRGIYNLVTRGKEPSGKMQERLSNAVHYGYGLAVAILYGIARTRPRRENLDLPGGLLLGLGLWAIGDELMVPLLGLSDAPTEFPASLHTQMLAAHLAYGAATAATAHALARLATRKGAELGPHFERWMVSGPVAWRSRTKKLTGMRAVPMAR